MFNPAKTVSPHRRENFLRLGAIINGVPLSWLIDATGVFCQSHPFHPAETTFGAPSPLTMFSSRSALRDGPLFRLVVWEHRSTARRLYASTIVAVSLSFSSSPPSASPLVSDLITLRCLRGCRSSRGRGGGGAGYRLKNVCPSRRPRSRPVRHTRARVSPIATWNTRWYIPNTHFAPKNYYGWSLSFLFQSRDFILKCKFLIRHNTVIDLLGKLIPDVTVGTIVWYMYAIDRFSSII